MSAVAADEIAIWSLINAWGHARDGGDWDALRNCFCADATINISWIHAPATEFVTRSIALGKKRKSGAHQKHVFAGPLVRINAGKAFSICHVQLENRDAMDGHEFDLQAWFRFFDLLRKEDDGKWRIHKRTAVYEKDKISAVDPRGAPAALFDGLDLSDFAPETKYLSWWQAKAGRTPRKDIVRCYSPEETAFKAEGLAWVA